MSLIRLAKPVPSALVLVLLAGSVTSADAHAILVDGQPRQGEAVAAGSSVIRLRYNSRIDHRRSRLTLTSPDHGQLVLDLDPADPADILSARTDLTPGSYTLHWQVLAVDGHITRGDIPFTVGAR